MKQPRLDHRVRWFLARSELAAVGADGPDVSLYWLTQNPPHATPLHAQWSPPDERRTGQVGIFIGAISAENRATMPDREREALLSHLGRWITQALGATPVWQSQDHFVMWSVDATATITRSDDDLDPGDHQAVVAVGRHGHPAGDVEIPRHRYGVEQGGDVQAGGVTA